MGVQNVIALLVALLKRERDFFSPDLGARDRIFSSGFDLVNREADQKETKPPG